MSVFACVFYQQENTMRKRMWEVVAYMPNHGQHYCNTFRLKQQAEAFATIQRNNPSFERVIVHEII